MEVESAVLCLAWMRLRHLATHAAPVLTNADDLGWRCSSSINSCRHSAMSWM